MKVYLWDGVAGAIGYAVGETEAEAKARLLAELEAMFKLGALTLDEGSTWYEHVRAVDGRVPNGTNWNARAAGLIRIAG